MSQVGVFCKKCSYDLRASTSRCPECGRDFDLQNTRTFRRRPFSPVRRRWAKRIIATFFLLLLAPTAIISPDYLEWRRNKIAAERIEKADGSTSWTKHAPWWSKYLGGRLSFLGDRLTYVISYGKGYQDWPRKITDDDLAYLAGLSELRILNLNAAGLVTDKGLASLDNMMSIEQLHLKAVQITDAGLKRLTSLKNLKRLDIGPPGAGVHSNAITDAGLSELKSLQKLEVLDVLDIDSCDKITGVGLRSLTEIKSLNLIWLINTQISDEDLQELKEAPGLGHLLLMNNPQITQAGVKRLQAAVPTLTITFSPPRKL